MKTAATFTALHDLDADLLILPFSSEGLKKAASPVLEAAGLSDVPLDDFKAAAGDTLILYPRPGKLRASRVMLVGTGEAKSLDDWHRAASLAASRAVDLDARRIVFDLPAAGGKARPGIEAVAEALVEGCMFGAYRFERLKSGKLDKGEKKKTPAKGKAKKDEKGIDLLTLRVPASAIAAAEKGMAAGLVIGSAQQMARDLVNLPGNHLQAEDIAKAAVSSGKQYGYGVTVLRKKEIESLRMGGLVAVNQGSLNPPTFTVMDYVPKKKAKATIALVGKGVTFDSGGISIKPSEGMGDMKSDMAGAAAVIGAVEAAARLSLPVRIIGLIPATDNMPDGNAQKPGDVITTYSGITVEVGNTDAEGRLILADALTYAAQKYSPDVIIDLATLTGACIVALGYQVAGLFSNDDSLAEAIEGAGRDTGEKVWRLPLWDLYDEQIKSDVADVSNTGSRGAGTITAAKFLEKFIEGHKKWAHIDIAGPSFPAKGASKVNGGSGFGVRLLVDLLRKWS
ncbi:MAG: cytosol aminopeptidase [Pelodictyon luteolum]|uniref:Probable cytosol aminopeptidase n=1 Tax=Pelodictyon luteolum TaxID=1100 RepID=A0A165M284_PELLU|nr:leucyl aminopeptidase [Pelodictyon luteolum]KZK74727.1 MAG: cytosol aminopeptidase [Pelodictyon luteolum]